MEEFLAHIIHIRCYVVEELAEGGTEVVEMRMTVGGVAEAVLRAAAVAGKEPRALEALGRKGIALGLSEGTLARAVHHRCDAVCVDIAQTIVGENEMIAGIDVAIELHDGGMTAGLRHGANARLLAHPARQRGIKELHENLADIMAHPFIEHRAEETSVLFGRHGEGREGTFAAFGDRGEVTTVVVRTESLNDRGKLDVARAYIFIEMVDLQGIVGIIVVDDTHGIPLHAMLLQETDAAHNLLERGLFSSRTTVFVVKLLRSVDADTDKEVVLAKELAPLVGEQGAIGLQAVVDEATVGVLTLELEGTLIETDGTHQRLAAMPGEENLRLGLRLDVLPDECFQGLVGHHAIRGG